MPIFSAYMIKQALVNIS